jgi:glutathione S-transferase
MMKLYQFVGSHFCEKARWALDYKRIGYQPINLVPGFHLKTIRKLARKTSLPVLVDGETVIQDSPAIITWLDNRFPALSLTPADPQAAREALDWEAWLDRHVGVNLRLWFYYYTLPHRQLALRFLLQGTHGFSSVAFRLVFPQVRKRMMQYMNINTDSAREAEAQVHIALQKLDEALTGREFLVGERFSRADLTACALLSPWCFSRDSDLPHEMLAARRLFATRRCYRYVLDVYERYRRHPVDAIASEPVLGQRSL